MPLTAKEVRNAKPGRHSDGHGLYMLVKPNGSRSWVLRVQSEIDGKPDRRDFGLGAVTLDQIPADIPLHKRKLLTLSEAREKARIGRALAKAGINPSLEWAKGPEQAARTFREAAKEYHEQTQKGWKNGKHRKQWIDSLELDAFPKIGDVPVEEVDASAIHDVLLPLWLTKPETARRVRQRIGVILDYAHGKNWRSSEAPMRAVSRLMSGIKQPKRGNFAAMPHAAVPAFVAALRERGTAIGWLALQFTILTAARSGEVRSAKWGEINLEAGEWSIPAEKMKAGKAHVIPLVPAALAILEEVRGLFPSSPDALVFPGNKGMMSDATMAKGLRTTPGGEGYTVHGFRSSFRDWAADHGFNNDWCEAALSHEVAGQEGKTVAAYRRTTFFDHRRDKLMPAWASFVLGNQSNVVQLAAARA